MADADDRPPGGGALLVAPEERAELRRLAGAAGEPDAATAGEVPRGAAARLARFQALVRAREAPPPAGPRPARGWRGAVRRRRPRGSSAASGRPRPRPRRRGCGRGPGPPARLPRPPWRRTERLTAPSAPPPRAAQLAKYQEQPALLDPLLEGLTALLVAGLREAARAAAGGDAAAAVARAAEPGRLLHALAQVRGPKALAKLLTPEAADLEPAAALLRAVGAAAPPPAAAALAPGWETQCMLLLWLSVLVLIPFDLRTVDSALGAEAAAAGDGPGEGPPALGPLVRGLVAAARGMLAEAGPVREAAATLLGRLLTRPDTGAGLGEFLGWARGVLAAEREGRHQGAFLVPGVARAVACVLKYGDRAALAPFAAAAWAAAFELFRLPGGQRNSLVRKLATKVVGRAALLYLEPRVAPWRYDRGRRRLLDGGGDGAAAGAGGAAGLAGRDDGAAEAADDEVDVPEQIEEAIEALLTGLRDKDTIVRWTAAKSLGRITGRLPRDLADDVVSFLTELFQPSEGDGAWHGGCLALAELARRGLLLPARLPGIVPSVTAALRYDVRRGPHSVGSHVRDAAAYVCWAFARAYAPEVMAGSVAALAPALLVASCYDREVNCRRAAAAAFQESVGRLGNFPDGIPIVTAADYFALSSRQHAYLVVAPYVAGFAGYRAAMVAHLTDVKLQHWEKALRELSAQGLALLLRAEPDPAVVAGVAAKLAARALHAALEVRHGALLGLAELLGGVDLFGPGPRAEGFMAAEAQRAMLARLTTLVAEVEKAKLYRGKGGETMREGVCRLVGAIATARLDLSEEVRAGLLGTLEENLRHPNEAIQALAAAAFAQTARAYPLGPAGAASTGPYVRKLIAHVADRTKPIARRGFSLALGALPGTAVAPMWRDVLGALEDCTRVAGDADADDAESRVNAVKSLARVVEELQGALTAGAEPHPSDLLELQEHLQSRAVPSLLRCLEDYTIDNRGDVGSWVREAAMGALVRCLAAARTVQVAHGGPPVSGELTARVFAGLLKQALEKIDRVRGAAGAHLAGLLYATPDDGAAHVAALKARIPEGEVVNWAAPSESFPRLVPLILVEPLMEQGLEGLVVSAGGLDNTLGKVATTALLEVLKGGAEGGGGGPAARGRLMRCLLGIFQRHQKDPRITLPLLKLLDTLFARRGAGAGDGLADAAEGLLLCVKEEVKGCRDIPRLQFAAAVLCHITVFRGPTREAALRAVLGLLQNRFPKVRKAMAEHLYMRLLALEDEDDGAYDEDRLEEAIDVVAETRWDGPSAQEVREARLKLYACFAMEPPAPPKKKGPAVPAKGSSADENSSYQSLVDTAGY